MRTLAYMCRQLFSIPLSITQHSAPLISVPRGWPEPQLYTPYMAVYLVICNHPTSLTSLSKVLYMHSIYICKYGSGRPCTFSIHRRYVDLATSFLVTAGRRAEAAFRIVGALRVVCGCYSIRCLPGANC